MEKTAFYILVILILASCAESAFDTSHSASLTKLYLMASEDTLNFSYRASKRSFDVITDETPWILKIPENVNWIGAAPMNGNSSQVVNVRTMSNNNSADTSRVCVVQLVALSDRQCSYPITIIQGKNAPYIRSDVSSITITASEQEKTILLSSNVQYTISNTAEDWLHIITTYSEGITFKADANNTNADRYCILTLTSKSSTVVIKQFQIIQKCAGI